MSVLVDSMDNPTDRAYSAWPDRVFLVDGEGRIAWKDPMRREGPRVEDVRGAIEQLHWEN